MHELRVEHATVRYPASGGRSVRAVYDVSFSLAPGEALGLVGESGCGKSSLARALVGLEVLTEGTATYGNEVLASGISSRALHRWRRSVQMVFQDPYSSLNPRLRIGDTLDEVLRVNTDQTKPQRISRIAELLDITGLPPESAMRYPHQFSGGQRQRIGIARALAVGAKVLILDEPVSALDVSVQAQVINLLEELREREKLSYLFVSHDLAVVEHLCKRMMVMYLGQIMERGESHEVCRAPKHPYTRALLRAVPNPVTGLGADYTPLTGEPPSPLDPPPGCPFHPRCTIANAQCSIRPYFLPNEPHASACPFTSQV